MYEILMPISTDLEQYVKTLPTHALGKNIAIHTKNKLPDFENVSLAILTVNESRGALNNKDVIHFDDFRKNFYQLFPGNWTKKIIDLGTLQAGETVNDTYVAVKILVDDLLKKNIVPIVIGGSQDITYGVYRGYDKLEQ